MEDGDHHQTGPDRAPQTLDHAVSAAPSSSDPDSAASRRMAYCTERAPFVSAVLWYGQTLEEPDMEQQQIMAERRRLASVVVTDPGAGLPPGYLKYNKVGARIMAAMGYKVGMGLGKDGIGMGIRMPLERPRRPFEAASAAFPASETTGNFPSE